MIYAMNVSCAFRLLLQSFLTIDENFSLFFKFIPLLCRKEIYECWYTLKHNTRGKYVGIMLFSCINETKIFIYSSFSCLNWFSDLLSLFSYCEAILPGLGTTEAEFLENALWENFWAIFTISLLILWFWKNSNSK